MRRQLAVAVLAIASVTACTDASSPTPPSARPSLAVTGQRFNDKIASSFTMPDPCTGEPILVTGTLHVNGITNQTATSLSLQAKTNTQGMTGIGLLTGNEYVFTLHEKDDVTLTFGAAPTDQEEIVFHYHVISKGPSDNFDVSVAYSVSAPPPGIRYSRNDARCTG